MRNTLTADNDKKLLAWVPINNPDYNALPDGVFDSEVFSMWSYVTHWGDWSAPLGRIPGAFLDVAHRTACPCRVWRESLTPDSLATITICSPAGNADVDKAAKFFRYYGIDGLGYNSEFNNGSTVMPKLRTFHINLNKKMKETNPLFENIWYDSTNDYGTIQFDQGTRRTQRQELRRCHQ